jgi:hypothetical protein
MTPFECRTLGVDLPEGVTVQLYPLHGPGKPLRWCFVKSGRLWPRSRAERDAWRALGFVPVEALE